MSSQQILEYVCWLVDANLIYEASLLTYDLELAAMTARCTQKVQFYSDLGSQRIHSLSLKLKRNFRPSLVQDKDLSRFEKARNSCQRAIAGEW